MQKIIMAFILLCILITVYAQDTQRKKEKDARILQLTKGSKLTDLLQTEWFGRKHSRDTKAYQHTSREKRALMLREDIKKGRVGGQIVDKLKSIPIAVQDAFLKVKINAVHDVGAGICVHNFVQTPCERHLQCSADCNDYVWVKDDQGRVNDLKRQYSMTVIAREMAEKNLTKIIQSEV